MQNDEGSAYLDLALRNAQAARDLERNSAPHPPKPQAVRLPREYESIGSTPFTENKLLKRGSAQPGCILGGLRFQSTAIRFFKFVWCFSTAGFP
jgi:hypothetical protein